MSRRDNDQIGHVPKMTPAHDEIASFQRSKARGSLASSLGDVPDSGISNASMSVKTLLAVVVVVLLATSGWAAYLHQQLHQAKGALTIYETRISDLEQRLSVTDESMSESTVAMKVKVREMDSEIRKLWDNVWKKSRARLDEHDKQLKVLQQGIKRGDSFMATTKQQLSQSDNVISGLTTKLNDVQKMETVMQANQQKLSQQESSIESANDKLNRLGTNVSKIDRRVKSTEEWVESINGFRRQVNRDVGGLKQRVGQLEAGNANTNTSPAPP